MCIEFSDIDKTPYNGAFFRKNDKQMFYKYLDNCGVYFEYGSGGSTYQASIRKNIKTIYSVESDAGWHEKLKCIIKTPNVKYLFNEMDTQANNWGHPGKNATDRQKINYSDRMRSLTEEEQNIIDLVLIDGRFRVACCLKCYDIISDNCLVSFDDFLNKPSYHVVLKYFDIVEKTIDNVMVILKKKKGLSVPKELIEKYELFAD